MKRLCDLVPCSLDIRIDGITDDSRETGENLLFFAVRGYTTDGHDYAADAVRNGAVAIACERPVEADAPQIIVKNSALAMNEALNIVNGDPLSRLKLIGVTGTDGKSSTATMIYELLDSLSACGMIGTKRVCCRSESRHQALTTPMPRELFATLAELRGGGCEYVAMEASSERLGTGRLAGIEFAASVFTNISNDHLDSHGSLEAYVAAKGRLFEQTSPDGICLIYNEDRHTDYFIGRSNGNVMTYGSDERADVYYTDYVDTADGSEFTLRGGLGEHRIVSPFVGRFNALNLTAAIAAVAHEGYPLERIIASARALSRIEGRQMLVREGQPFAVIVDFAHTANAVSHLIDYAKTIATGKIICVLGTGGNRALLRQTELGAMVVERGDYVYLTTYNPRGEDAEALCRNMLLTADTAKNNFEIELDRKTAIEKAIARAEAGDAVLITGKGVEYFQLLGGGIKIPYEGDYENAVAAVHKKIKP